MSVALCIQAVVCVAIGCIAAIPTLFQMLISFLKGPRSFLTVKDRDVMPECLKDPALGTHGYIQLEEVKIHYVASGEESKPLMLFLHGFPEFWYSWRFQIREFQKDYRVVAIDMRGYADSGKPSGVGNYKMTKLVGDIRQLIPALGYRSCVLVAHDWGGFVAWSFASLHQDMVDKLIIMNIPHPSAFWKYVKKHLSQFQKSMYMFLFQLPFLAELLMRSHDYVFVDSVFLSETEGVRKGNCTKEDVEAYKYAHSQEGGLTGGLNYYRALMRTESPALPKIQKPVLLIWGCEDRYLEKGLAECSKLFKEDLKIRYIENATHWVQMDQPEQTNKLMRDFLKGLKSE